VNSWTRKMPQTSLPCCISVSSIYGKPRGRGLPFQPPCESMWNIQRIYRGQHCVERHRCGRHSLQWELFGLDPFVAVICADRLLGGLGQSASYPGTFHCISTGSGETYGNQILVGLVTSDLVQLLVKPVPEDEQMSPRNPSPGKTY
jgi:hypothetical protein